MAVRFDPNSLLLFNAILALIMSGVVLRLRLADFSRVIKSPGIGSVSAPCPDFQHYTEPCQADA